MCDVSDVGVEGCGDGAFEEEVFGGPLGVGLDNGDVVGDFAGGHFLNEG